MVTGKYLITMQLLGRTEAGVVTINESEGKISGFLKAGNVTSYFKNGKIENNCFEFSGMLKKLLFKVYYTAKGEVKNDKLKATAITKYGTFEINGTRV